MDSPVERLSYLMFRQFGDQVLITNDAGRHQFLSPDGLRELVTRPERLDVKTRQSLAANYFLLTSPGSDDTLVEETRRFKSHLFESTPLHIFVLTNACNHECLYCQASASNKTGHKTHMSLGTAQRCVDVALSSPSPTVAIEFQGGEPLLNFDALRYVVERAESRAAELGKQVTFSVVSNLSLLDDTKMEFLVNAGVQVCTSLDGPRSLHNRNRPLPNRDAHATTVEALHRLNQRLSLDGETATAQALMTTTRHSLGQGRAIIDEYLGLGLGSISSAPYATRPISRRMGEIGYEAEEFVEFYSECLNYLVELNATELRIREVHTEIFLRKILADEQLNYMELRSPCGGAIGQLAYDWNGECTP